MLTHIAGALALSMAAAALPSAALAAPAVPEPADLYIGAFHEPIRKVVGDGESEIVYPSRDVAAFTADRFGGLIVRTYSYQTGHDDLRRVDADGAETALPLFGSMQYTTQAQTGELYAGDGEVYKLTGAGWEYLNVGMSMPYVSTFTVAADGTVYTADGWVNKWVPGGNGGEPVSEFLGTSKIAIDDDGNIYADRVEDEGTKHSVVRLTTNGEMTTIAEGPVDGIQTDAAGNVYLSRADDMRIDVISPDGATTSISTAPYKPVYFSVGAGR